MLHGCGYSSNVSLARFRDHRQVAERFAAAAAAEPRRPDIIVAGLPTIELCLESTRYGKQRGVPVVLDMRDMWPDVFLELLPPALRSAGLSAVGIALPQEPSGVPRRDRDHRNDGRLRRLGTRPRRPPAVSARSQFLLRLRSHRAVGGEAGGRRGLLEPARGCRHWRFQRGVLRRDRPAVQPRTDHRGRAPARTDESQNPLCPLRLRRSSRTLQIAGGRVEQPRLSRLGRRGRDSSRSCGARRSAWRRTAKAAISP